MANTIKDMQDLIGRTARAIQAIQPDEMARMSGPLAEELRACLEASKVYTAMGSNGPRSYTSAPEEDDTDGNR
jgi:hypothetical protein